MINASKKILFFTVLIGMLGCTQTATKMKITAKEILGNPDYQAISYGGYRENTREIEPTKQQLKEDMRLLAAMGVKILRTYNVQLKEVPNLLEAITELKNEDTDFEMYVMLGAWIDCKNAWTGEEPDHNTESEANAAEIDRAVALANAYPDIVKILAVGNEAMVRWATSYYVQPAVILKWVNHLQELKKKGNLPADLWITCSDDFASWGGGDSSYHTPDLEKLMQAVDYISMHTYPMHNTYYNPGFWVVPEDETDLPENEKIDKAMVRSLEFAQNQYTKVKEYMKSLGINKPVHIGETGWASISNGHYGKNSSRACDEYKAGLYYNQMREWTNQQHITCFYFEAFDEQWKDAKNSKGSENHFGLMNLKGEAKFPLWDLVEKGAFKGLTRDGQVITKTYQGSMDSLIHDAMVPPLAAEMEGVR